LTNRYLHGPAWDMVLADEYFSGGVSQGNRWALTDHLGTVRDLVDNSGAVVKHLKYDSWGNIRSDSAPAVNELFADSGRQFDKEIEGYDNRGREDDPRAGRFFSEDRTGLSGGDTNQSRDRGNNPISRKDPDGNKWYDWFAPGASLLYEMGRYVIGPSERDLKRPINAPPPSFGERVSDKVLQVGEAISIAGQGADDGACMAIDAALGGWSPEGLQAEAARRAAEYDADIVAAVRAFGVIAREALLSLGMVGAGRVLGQLGRIESIAVWVSKNAAVLNRLGRAINTLGAGTQLIQITQGLLDFANALRRGDKAAAYEALGKSIVGAIGLAESARQFRMRFCTGQQHHIISKRVEAALKEHPVLGGRYTRESGPISRAVNKRAHNGYRGTWHEDLDNEIIQWLEDNRNATPEQFEAFLLGRYAQPDLLWRFPEGFYGEAP
jgi:RHS repeat-associated protein